jgi:putative spermidine/putrescine transport system permease protein
MSDSLDSRWPRILTGIIAAAVLVFLTGPLVVVVIQSFTAESYLSFPPPRFGVRWYVDVFQAEEWRQGFVLSLIIGLIVTPLTLIIGTAAALGLDRGPLRGKQALYALLISPMVLPHIVLGLGIFRIALQLQISDSLWSYVPAHLTITVPFVVVTVGASLRSFDIGLEEAARSLGASPFRALWHVTLPVIRPGLIAGGVFSFIISFDEFIITFFLASYDLTLPLVIFSTLMYQVKPSIAAVSALTIAVTALLTALLMTRGQVVSGGKIVR